MNNSIITSLGVSVNNLKLEDAITAAGLNFELASEPAQTASGIKMPRKKILYRKDNNLPLGLVGDEYVATVPRKFVEHQYEVAERLGGTVTQIGFLPDRARAFAFIKMEKNLNVPTKENRKKGDPVAVYIYNSDGWDGMTPRRSKMYFERLSCANGMTSRDVDSAASLWVSHTSRLEERYAPKWGAFEAEVTKQITYVREQYAQLAAASLAKEQMEAFLKKLLPGDSKMTENRRKEIMNLFNDGTATRGETKWDGFNAVTEYVTHHRTYRDGGATSVQTNRFLGVLETDTMKEKAMELLLATN